MIFGSYSEPMARWFVNARGRYVRRKRRAPKAPLEDPGRQHRLERKRERQRRFQERLKSLLDVRVCGICKYGFVSRGGSNICSECCWQKGSLRFENMRRGPSIRRTMIILGREFPSWVTTRTVHPAIPVPDLQSIWVQLSIKKTYQQMERSQQDGIYHCHVMPRLINLKPYPREEFKGFKTGRPTKDAAFYRNIENAKLP
jgi:hypothetical protein